MSKNIIYSISHRVIFRQTKTSYSHYQSANKKALQELEGDQKEEIMSAAESAEKGPRSGTDDIEYFNKTNAKKAFAEK